MVDSESMAVTAVSGGGVPIRGEDIDTDQILPARFLKEVTFENMGEYAFHDARYNDEGDLTNHPLNTYDGNVLVVNDNFGCGSSREHAPQGLMRWGIDAIVGESFAEIFADNCKSLGIPTLTAPRGPVTELQSFIEASPSAEVTVDVTTGTVAFDDGHIDAEIDTAAQEALLKGVYDTTAVMYANRETARETAADLPYVDAN
ncbi:MAG: 3-isopropylmalate dehydratase, small subunit [uncultured archaeon A07HR60]|jgi:3-isopropylmalate dehydratase, small subunit (EC 4.2.1.33)|nr:MAG: 3-isopropylmalate dehydratase small subunit [Halorubrum sp. J07HR59]ESS10850.1 MAG: 3-isopropylmalate dehydratase, small subunit [uncultured archaeon A07HR60]